MLVIANLPPQLYAMGDVHGDYERMVELLSSANLVAGPSPKPQEARWTGGSAVLIVTGDFIDKFDRSIDVIAVLRRLQSQADAAGGSLIITLGNHETKFLAGASSVQAGSGKAGAKEKKAASLLKELEAAGLSSADIGAGRDSQGIGAWMRNLPVAVKVGDWFFCHAGNTGGLSLEKLEAELEKDISTHGFGCPMLADPNSILQARMHPRQWWDASTDVQLKDVNSTGAEQTAAASAGRLRSSVEALGCHHLVIGHQPGKIVFADGSIREAGQIVKKFGGLLYMTDTGMSRGANGGRGALLKISSDAKNSDTKIVYADGKAESL